MNLPRLRPAWLWLRKYWWRLWLGERLKVLAELAGTAGHAGLLALLAVGFGHVWAAWLVAMGAVLVALWLVRRRRRRLHRYRTFRFPLRDQAHPAVAGDHPRPAGDRGRPRDAPTCPASGSTGIPAPSTTTGWPEIDRWANARLMSG